MSQHQFNSFWYGKSLTPYEVLCIKSFLDHGHAFRLYTYEEMAVPVGTELCDANEIVPRDQVFFYNSGPGAGSVAAFANKFRYALLAQRGGWWVDIDIICLSADIPQYDSFFAFEEGKRINNGMLYFPAGSAVMQACLEGAEASGQNLVWGQTGPKLLTETLEGFHLTGGAQPISLCYAIEWQQYLYFWDPALFGTVESAVSASMVVHLWNEMIRRIGLNKQKAPPPGSYLDYLCKRHAIEFSQPPISAVEIHLLQQFIRFRGGLVRRLTGEQRWLQFGPVSKT